jgi:type IV secretory pathway VirB2 component (pilin)
MAAVCAMPTVGLASVESTLQNVQDKLIDTILPLVSVLGLVWAGLSLISGNPNARSHLTLAMIGAAIGFGAESIRDFIRGLVH